MAQKTICHVLSHACHKHLLASVMVKMFKKETIKENRTVIFLAGLTDGFARQPSGKIVQRCNSCEHVYVVHPNDSVRPMLLRITLLLSRERFSSQPDSGRRPSTVLGFHMHHA